jgi:hypothetical protein
MKGPQAVGVSSESQKDPIGIMLRWTPEQAITNCKHRDQFFAVRAVQRGSSTLAQIRARVRRRYPATPDEHEFRAQV